MGPHVLCLFPKAGTSVAFVPLGPLPCAPNFSGHKARPEEWRLGGPGGLRARLLEHHAAQIFIPRLASVPSLA